MLNIKINKLTFVFVILGIVGTVGVMYLKIIPSRLWKKYNSFIFGNTTMCINEKSQLDEIGETMAMTDLEKENPIVIFPSGGRSTMKKISETDDILVIQLVASLTGSTDVITLFKKSGKFERESKGSLGGDYSFKYSGHCWN